jgi:hypothetical protein
MPCNPQGRPRDPVAQVSINKKTHTVLPHHAELLARALDSMILANSSTTGSDGYRSSIIANVGAKQADSHCFGSEGGQRYLLQHAALGNHIPLARDAKDNLCVQLEARGIVEVDHIYKHHGIIWCLTHSPQLHLHWHGEVGEARRHHVQPMPVLRGRAQRPPHSAFCF